MLAVRHRQHGVITVFCRGIPLNLRINTARSCRLNYLHRHTPMFHVSFLHSGISVDFQRSSFGVLEQADEAFAQKLWENTPFLTFPNSIFIPSASRTPMWPQQTWADGYEPPCHLWPRGGHSLIQRGFLPHYSTWESHTLHLKFSGIPL